MEYLVELNGVKYRQVENYEISYDQLWAEGSGRNYGDYRWSGTIAGNFDSVKLNILPKNKLELSNLIKYLRRGIFPIKYYDFEAMDYITRNVYRANFKVKAVYIGDSYDEYELVELTFTPESRR